MIDHPRWSSQLCLTQLRLPDDKGVNVGLLHQALGGLTAAGESGRRLQGGRMPGLGRADLRLRPLDIIFNVGAIKRRSCLAGRGGSPSITESLPRVCTVCAGTSNKQCHSCWKLAPCMAGWAALAFCGPVAACGTCSGGISTCACCSLDFQADSYLLPALDAFLGSSFLRLWKPRAFALPLFS